MYSQRLLRAAISDINEQTSYEVQIEPRLSKVVDLWIDRFPTGENFDYDKHKCEVHSALDYLANFVLQVHKVSISWRVMGDKILVFYAGNKEEYAKLRKRDDL